MCLKATLSCKYVQNFTYLIIIFYGATTIEDSKIDSNKEVTKFSKKTGTLATTKFVALTLAITKFVVFIVTRSAHQTPGYSVFTCAFRRS